MSEQNNKIVSLRKQPKEVIINFLEKLKNDDEIKDIVIIARRKDHSMISMNSDMTNERFLWIIETEKFELLLND